jgi:hypothetical protein
VKVRQKSGTDKEPTGTVVKEIRRKTRRRASAEAKICFILEGLRSPIIADCLAVGLEYIKGERADAFATTAAGRSRGRVC